MKKATSKKKTASFLGKARSWAIKKGLLGPQAFLKFVILNFVECLNVESNEFIFKGGNLLWIYIQTPRQTIDLDLATRTLNNKNKIEELLIEACKFGDSRGIQYTLSHFNQIKDSQAASARIHYKTDAGAQNSFELDIVFAIPTNITKISSPIESNIQIPVASIENIIADKLGASARFEAGNTRMKDFDDLWRISISKTKISSDVLVKLLKSRKIIARLDTEWINPVMEQDWKRHAKRYKDLPSELKEVFYEVNTWLQALKGEYSDD